MAIEEGGLIRKGDPDFDVAVNTALYGMRIAHGNILTYRKNEGLRIHNDQPWKVGSLLFLQRADPLHDVTSTAPWGQRTTNQWLRVVLGMSVCARFHYLTSAMEAHARSLLLNDLAQMSSCSQAMYN